MALLPTDPQERRYILLGLRIIGDFGATIAVPVVLFVLIGQWFDEKYDKSPLFTIIAFVLAAILSGRMIYKKTRAYGKEYQSIEKKHKK